MHRELRTTYRSPILDFVTRSHRFFHGVRSGSSLPTGRPGRGFLPAVTSSAAPLRRAEADAGVDGAVSGVAPVTDGGELDAGESCRKRRATSSCPRGCCSSIRPTARASSAAASTKSTARKITSPSATNSPPTQHCLVRRATPKVLHRRVRVSQPERALIPRGWCLGTTRRPRCERVR